jgi:Flp pilus assembly protein TadD
MWSRAGTQAVVVAFVLGACAPQADRLGTGAPSLNTAQTALANGAPEFALQICTTLLENGQRGPDVLVCQGNALTALGRNGEAGSSFAAALVAQPGSLEAMIGVGRLRLATNPIEAERLFLQVLAKQPRNPVALNNLGIARDLQGRHQDAQAAYGEAIGAAPDLRAPQVNLALSMALSGRAGEASRLMRPIADRPSATPRERHDFAAILAMEGRSDEAARYLQPELSGLPMEHALAGFRSMPAGVTQYNR